MDWQIVINGLLGGLLSLLGLFCNELWTNLKSLQKQVHKLKVDMAQNYARKDEPKYGLIS